MTTMLDRARPDIFPVLPLAGDIPEPPEEGHDVIDLAKTCCELARRIDPAEHLRINFSEARLSSDPGVLRETLEGALHFLRSHGFDWISVDANQTAPGWIGLAISGDARPEGTAPAILRPEVEATAPELVQLKDLRAPERGFLSLRQRKHGLNIVAHMNGRVLSD